MFGGRLALLYPSSAGTALLVEVQTIDRRLDRGPKRLEELDLLLDVGTMRDLRDRQPSVEQALYLLFNEGTAASRSPSFVASTRDAQHWPRSPGSTGAPGPGSMEFRKWAEMGAGWTLQREGSSALHEAGVNQATAHRAEYTVELGLGAERGVH